MSADNFLSVVRLNLLENFKPSAARKNIPKLTMVDIEAKIMPLYMFAPQKPTRKDLDNSLEILENKGYLLKTTTDGYDYWTITHSGSHALLKILEGEDVAI